jgi:16S rRNA (uracil1498-N3)-methyltransferase
VRVFNATDGEFDAVVTASKKGKVDVKLAACVRPAETTGLALHLALGLSRGDRMDYAIQKATELGRHADYSAVHRTRRGSSEAGQARK